MDVSEPVQGRFSNRSFVEKAVMLDGSTFSDCVFSHCRLVYSGGDIPVLTGCQFNECNWQFSGDAANTIAFLSSMYQGGFDRLIESTFHEIRRGAMINQPALPGPAAATASTAAKFLKPLRIFRMPKPESRS
ncbi:hypothetical protein PZ897_01820 [Hoeflea sp. YIM 152468]|uniref:hypothetical protein n=1 Tax=Hoeflea sp. YIM 152468 TaxID=3031759 RepID=UPI0023D98E5D|nr:hypothetical protein [Hoeflea sp. YIM 152468]MDF1606907.1 hypothetical protein [Hoeflea sp. YIM 152468]